MDQYKLIIGLETHVELKTKSKMFCQCSGDYFGKSPNSNTCPVCLGLPGALPVPNGAAIEWTVKIAKALQCTIPHTSHFDRKHYFYPDLPKGYQISQYDEPIGVAGSLTFARRDGTQKTVRITRVHLEEDTGKLIHSTSHTLVDFNRSGVPLVEIVTEPDFDSADDVKMYLEELHALIVALDVSDADMEKGSMRMEPNISVTKAQDTHLPSYKVEVKNINSFRYVKQAIEYEFMRQSAILKDGKVPSQETRGFDEKKVCTYSQRSKEEAHDYRYFPEPDIPPLALSDAWIRSITVPELPIAKELRLCTQLKIRQQDAHTLSHDMRLWHVFESVLDDLHRTDKTRASDIPDIAQKLANTIINKRLPVDLPLDQFVKKFLESIRPISVDTDKLNMVIRECIKKNQTVVADYRGGKVNAIMYLVGQVMKEMQGKADARIVKEQLESVLSQ